MASDIDHGSHKNYPTHTRVHFGMMASFEITCSDAYSQHTNCPAHKLTNQIVIYLGMERLGKILMKLEVSMGTRTKIFAALLIAARLHL